MAAIPIGVPNIYELVSWASNFQSRTQRKMIKKIRKLDIQISTYNILKDELKNTTLSDIRREFVLAKILKCQHCCNHICTNFRAIGANPQHACNSILPNNNRQVKHTLGSVQSGQYSPWTGETKFEQEQEPKQINIVTINKTFYQSIVSPIVDEPSITNMITIHESRLHRCALSFDEFIDWLNTSMEYCGLGDVRTVYPFGIKQSRNKMPIPKSTELLFLCQCKTDGKTPCKKRIHAEDIGLITFLETINPKLKKEHLKNISSKKKMLCDEMYPDGNASIECPSCNTVTINYTHIEEQQEYTCFNKKFCHNMYCINYTKPYCNICKDFYPCNNECPINSNIPIRPKPIESNFRGVCLNGQHHTFKKYD